MIEVAVVEALAIGGAHRDGYTLMNTRRMKAVKPLIKFSMLQLLTIGGAYRDGYTLMNTREMKAVKLW